MNIPVSTYRIQFNPEFTFKDACATVDYLCDLGITCLYASPIFKARKGSTHGYDLVDPARINPELGTDNELKGFIKELQGKGIEWLQDIVPNHMAIDSENAMLMDIFEFGEKSQYFHFFDIDWNHPYENMKGRVLLPVLGKFYAECLHDGEIRLAYDRQGLHIKYYSLRLPLKIDLYPVVLEKNLNSMEERFGKDSPNLIKFLGALNLFKTPGASSKEKNHYTHIQHAKEMLWSLYNENTTVKEFIEGTLELFNGKTGDINSFDLLDSLISKQIFRLSFWKAATEEINYRRFFTINDLISVRVEDRSVFEFTHRFVFQFIKEGLFNGLRIDHIDGLYDPAKYIKWLRQEIGDVYIVVEKILESDEKLPSFLDVQGTTGYDFMDYVNDIFCDTANGRTFSRIYCKFTDLYNQFDELVSEKKRLIISEHMAGNIDNLAHYIKNISVVDRLGRDLTLYGLRRALVEVMAHFPVYRTYISPECFEEMDKAYIKQAIELTREKLPRLSYEIAFIEKFLLLQFDDWFTDEDKKKLIHFVMSFQQQTGPLMAKGFEDTILYIYNRLISLNEVGSNPKQFGCSLDEFHAYTLRKKQSYPHSLNATSTHDTKRGEDVRARINVLSELPMEWERCLKLWNKLNRKKKKKCNNNLVPDKNDEYFLYQTLLGVFPFNEEPDFLERMKNYIIKAVREAKVHTAWIKPDAEYEQTYTEFLEKILLPSDQNHFLEEFLNFQRKIAFYGIFNSLSITLLKLTCPGIPDFYQGTELWDLSLVDPDNRRPVAFDRRKEYLSFIKEKIPQNILELIKQLLAAKEDGRIKLFLIHRALYERENNRDIFLNGEYIPLNIEGIYKDCIIAFARQYQGQTAIVVVPRFLTRVVKEGDVPLGKDVWKDTAIFLPPDYPYAWEDAITSQKINGGNTLSVGEILKYFPVSLLRNI
jgi:(1->4)-alpha-D-glucan 1-alpha-D-glucosylmutase